MDSSVKLFFIKSNIVGQAIIDKMENTFINKYNGRCWVFHFERHFFVIVPNTDYGHTMAKYLILCGPNSNPNPK